MTGRWATRRCSRRRDQDGRVRAADLPRGWAVRRTDQAGQDLVLRGHRPMGFHGSGAERLLQLAAGQGERARAKASSDQRRRCSTRASRARPTPTRRPTPADRPRPSTGTARTQAASPIRRPRGTASTSTPTSRRTAAAPPARSPAPTRSNLSAAGTGIRRASCRARGRRRSPAACCSRPALRGRRPTG